IMIRNKVIVGLSKLLVFRSVTCAPEGEPRHRELLAAPGPRDGEAAKPPIKVPPTLKKRIEAAIQNIESRQLETTNSFWTVFHGILGMGPQTATLMNPETGEKVNAVDYITSGGDVRGMKFIPSRHGVDVRTGPQFVGQGHQDQFVAEMVEWGLPADRE